MSDYQIIEGDSAKVLQGMDDCSVDMVATDVPYGILFMGKEWDAAAPLVSIFEQCLRVLKPGGAFVTTMSTRLDRLWRVCRDLEEVGFNLQQTSFAWVYRSGFCKGADLSKTADRRAGAERKVVGERADFKAKHAAEARRGADNQRNYNEAHDPGRGGFCNPVEVGTITAPATPLACALEGQYSRGKIKPAFELIIFARKPIESGTIPTPELAALLDAHDWPSDYIHNRKETVGTDEKSRAQIIKLCKQHGVRPYLKGGTPARALPSWEEWYAKAKDYGGSRREYDKLADGPVESRQRQAALTVDNQTSLREGLECRVVVTHAGGETVVATSKYKARLPRSEWTNVVEWGTGAVNCGACMVPADTSTARTQRHRTNEHIDPDYVRGGWRGTTDGKAFATGGSGGRFPANVLCTGDKPLGDGTRFFDVELWAEQHGLAEEGWAEAAEAGLIQVPKAAKSEKQAGCESLPQSKATVTMPMVKQCANCGGKAVNTNGLACGCDNPQPILVPQEEKPRGNIHPTSKPVRLFAYLISLLCPAGGTVLDCFAGSGSTGVAAIQCGRSFIGVELETDYVTIAEARCQWAEQNMPEAQGPEQLSLEEAAQ